MTEPPTRHPNPISPISQLLQSIGMTRDDLTRHSDQMRQFLTAETTNSLHAFSQDQSDVESVSTPTLAPAQIFSQSRSVSATDASTAGRRTPPPVTPIKTEPLEPSSSLRRFESMEEIIERQNRRSKRDRRSKREREASPALPRSPSLSASRAGRMRDLGRVVESDDQSPTRDAFLQDNLPPPVTPRAGRYYRETVLYQTVTHKTVAHSDVFIPRNESPSPSSSRRNSVASSIRSVSVESVAAKAASPFPPVTPRRNYYKSQFTSSSPAVSTPSSSPSRTIVNIVSSPGPMGPEPTEDDYDELPFKVPPGPYSPHKPDLPYAAMIGQAILASPEHRLTLQEIYDYITIVYPHFKRNEQTWMNSIRHVLSTTIVFRKVQRDRAAGRTLWAIFDRDLDCFLSGGFRKEYCADMQEQKEKARYTSRKRPAEDSATRKAKRSKKTMQAEIAQEQAPLQMGIPLSAVPLSFSTPLFPPPTHQQPYYAPYVLAHHGHPHHVLPVGVIFPALPPGYQHMGPVALPQPVIAADGPSTIASTSASTSASIPNTSIPASTSVSVAATASSPSPADLNPFIVDRSPSPPPVTVSSSSSSMPSLTPSTSNSSSSPPERPEESVELAEIRKARAAMDISAYIVDPEEPPLDALAPGVTLLNGTMQTLEKPGKAKAKAKAKSRKGKEKELSKERPPPKRNVLPFPPDSPSLNSKAALPRVNPPRPSTPPRDRDALPVPRPFVTPPQRPSTPPRKGSAGHQLSAMRTPLSHLGVHMSPSPSLAHYRSNLNPPPTASFPAAEADSQKETAAPTASSDDAENLLRTPSRRRNGTHITPFTPATPRKLVFPGSQESPYRTSGRGIFDPHDPSAMLDDELARLGAQGSGLQESPTGLFGRNRGMLYESPDVPSPGRWTRMW